MVFEDLHTYNGYSCYTCTNESIPIWWDVLGDIKAEHSAGICSGGEIGFFVLLPATSKRVDLIDHSYDSMAFAIGKYHLAEKVSAKKAIEFLGNPPSYRDSPTQKYFAQATKDLPTRRASNSSYRFGWPSIYGKIVTRKHILSFQKNLHKISFLHGDISDLKERGPYDLLYLSNALEYDGRQGYRHPQPIKEIVKPGGYVLYSSFSRDSIPASLRGFKTVVSKNCLDYRNEQRKMDTYRWYYNLVQVPE